MMIRLSDGFIGFENIQGEPQFWQPTKHDLKEFAENAIFWSSVKATRTAHGFAYHQIWSPETARMQRGGTVGS